MINRFLFSLYFLVLVIANNSYSQTEGVFGNDNRQLVEHKKTDSLYSFIGLLVKHEQQNSFEKFEICTATIIEQQFLITAAHCVTTDYAIYPYFLFSFYPGHNSVEQEEAIKLDIAPVQNHIFIPDEYIKLKDHCLRTTLLPNYICSTNNYDLAVIMLKDKINAPTPKLKPVDLKIGDKMSMSIAGYPGDKSQHHNKDGVDEVYKAFHLYEVAGENEVIINNELGPEKVFSTTLDLSQGMSGSSYIDNDGFVRGVFTSTVAMDKKPLFNKGLIITPDLYSRVMDWIHSKK